MVDIAALRIGQKVHYQPEHYSSDKWENGMIKEIPERATDKDSLCFNSVRVVYNCDGDWENFKNYTSALTNLRDLKLGWKHEDTDLCFTSLIKPPWKLFF